MSEGDLSGMDSEVVEERVVAIEAVVASSKEGGVQGSSGRPEETSRGCSGKPTFNWQSFAVKRDFK